MEPPEVTVLIHRAAEGDAAAWNAIVDEYSGLLWSVVRGFRLNEAQTADAVQTTWLRLVEHVADLREPDHVAGWLKTTANRVCLQVIRQSGREQLTDWDDHRGLGAGARYDGLREDGPEAAVLQQEHQVLVRRALAELPDRHRQLMELLMAFPPISYQDISARLGMPVGSIGPTRARILARLRVALATAGLEDLVAR
ncbi:RNA polymerase sigma factor (sigma-70 family) [Geodermatophilus tzadiensis]|uniref:RNA polymerase sigma factor (Sigma-70 family) n=1 Tax=Geodermatophilus tzadiensis TaxID=1137988 RepID=A0A2T0SQ77_9ACTN|nr:sigma-70 family RNA polymerase sigma factor [Geodermatophilus tzadiensis]PRY35569.1 RNA polymerase sigma factor (sigma-70 family) [Geodermatophilus tzadiensis]